MVPYKRLLFREDRCIIEQDGPAEAAGADVPYEMNGGLFMKYDFNAPVNRRHTSSLKWDVADNELPMWVADMDFPCAPEIQKELQKRLSHGVFGYSVVPEEWYAAICGWWETRHHFRMEKDWLIFCTGVVPALSSIVRKLTTPGENVLIQTPVYNIFFNSIVNNGRNVLESPLLYRNGTYSVDFADLERKLADPQTSLMILCNPHNPVGKIWDRRTLARIGRLAAAHHVTVVSDEIHCDLTDPGEEYVPFASVNKECRQNSVTCIAPTKAFNLAGLQTAAVCVPDPVLRHKVWRGLNTDEAAEPNAFAVPAAVAAFTKGADWLDGLRDFLFANKQTAAAFLKEYLPQIRLVPSKATYLLWLDCQKICSDTSRLQEFLRRETGLYVSEGSQYGRAGAAFLRLNIACSRGTLEDGLCRLREGITRFVGENAQNYPR